MVRNFTDFSVQYDASFKDGVKCNARFKIDEKAFRNIESMISGKSGDDVIFNISAKEINAYLAEAIPGLTAKVFRTSAASSKLQSGLAKIDPALPKKDKVSEIQTF